MDRFLEALSVDDVLLEPRISTIGSRDDINLSQDFRFDDGRDSVTYPLPIMSAPMDTVTGALLARNLLYIGGAPVLPRFEDVKQTLHKVRTILDEIKEAGKCPIKARTRLWASVGLIRTKDDMAAASQLVDAGLSICIDVAHGGNRAVVETAQTLQALGATLIMAGNVATPDEASALVDVGVDVVRVGVGSGSCCTTRIKTGHGLPTFQSVYDISNHFDRSGRSAAIVADGGVKNSGDIVKLLGAGASVVMLGNLLAATEDSAAPYADASYRWKKIRGMASSEAKAAAGLDRERYVEGESGLVQCSGPLVLVLPKLMDGVRSGLAYSGAKDLSEFRAKARFRKITQNGLRESGAHSINKG